MKYRIHGMFFASSMGIRLAIALCCALLGVRVQLAQDADTGLEEPAESFVTLQTKPYDKDGKKVVSSVDIPLIYAKKSEIIADHIRDHNNEGSVPLFFLLTRIF